jgi:hypothetical protein
MCVCAAVALLCPDISCCVALLVVDKQQVAHTEGRRGISVCGGVNPIVF